MEHGLESPGEPHESGMPDDNINISDVIEIIETDPDFLQSSSMFNGGGEIPQPARPQPVAQVPAQQARRHAYVKLIEQPASKALRFRYECEGRSAGSIPGVSSTPENKTFPAIQIIGYQGRAVVVVSCVTKDPPYRPHPHNLVGREGCKKGVCTLEVSPETMSVTFSNLGIQCVKKKDIESALKVREEIRVDPFRTGFAHRNQPTSIDLNAVRLCFQVFLEGDHRGKFTVPLTPVVSEPIYDKKAMSDLVIVKLSDCVSSVDGGRKDTILLCEKVAKEDIQIRFYEERDGQIVWEGIGDFQPSQVHKQTAIWFRTPRYRTLDVTEPVKVFIQLRRPSDGATSEPLPFELLPLDSGRPAFWSFRRNLAKKGNYNLFSSILNNDARLIAKRQLSNIPSVTSSDQTTTDSAPQTVILADDTADSNLLRSSPANHNETQNTVEWCDYSQVEKVAKNPENNVEEKSFNELINQVAELDEIYSESRARMLSMTDPIDKDKSNDFDDAQTYTSLQLAFKNPVSITETADKDTYDDVTVLSPSSPIIDVTPLKRESDHEKLPPLPPKRAKKVTDICEPYVPANLGSTHSVQLAGKPAAVALGDSTQNVNKPITRSASFNLTRPKSQNELAPSKKLPPTPSSTLPNPKKRGFFSKLFSRKKNKSLNASRNSITGSKSLSIGNVSANKDSTDNISTHSHHSNVSIHIPLKDPLPDGNENLENNGSIAGKNVSTDWNANDDLAMNLDLTEAEHYALYMAMAPHATQSEFDETSCYYSPVEGGKVLAEDVLVRIQGSKT